ncbi:MAG: hypothetical protein LBN27_12150 [Prevotellaceae bacterium]|jgi:predicted DNA-binding transcriptional regulator AlpA|nr:hypothetical protein [Prevotellaceae bacterium]
MRKREWTQEQKRFIADNHLSMTIMQIAIALKIPRLAVGNYMRLNCLTANRSLHNKRISESLTVYTEELDDYIKENYPRLSMYDIAHNTGASRTTVAKRIHKLGLEIVCQRRFIIDNYAEIDDFIKNNYPKIGLKRIANRLHTTDEIIRRRVLAIGMEVQPKNRPRKHFFSEGEYRFICDNYQAMGYRQIAKKMGIDENAVYRFIKKNNINKIN